MVLNHCAVPHQCVRHSQANIFSHLWLYFTNHFHSFSGVLQIYFHYIRRYTIWCQKMGTCAFNTTEAFCKFGIVYDAQGDSWLRPRLNCSKILKCTHWVMWDLYFRDCWVCRSKLFRMPFSSIDLHYRADCTQCWHCCRSSIWCTMFLFWNAPPRLDDRRAANELDFHFVSSRHVEISSTI
jgi:hypothetical protein